MAFAETPHGAAVRTALAAAASALAAWGLWSVFGPVGLVFAAPLAGVLLARPLIDLAGDLGHGTRRAALGATEGAYYAFKGRPLRVAEDDEGRRWLCAADLRRCVPGLPADASLAHQLGDGARRLGPGGRLHVEAEALHAALARALDPQTVRFRQWLDREVVQPAARRRARGPAPTIPG